MTTQAQNTEKEFLSKSHIEVFQAIEKYINKNKYAPTLPELSRKLGRTERNIYTIIEGLVEKGYIKKIPYKSRNLIILKTIE